ncbi:chordin [Leptodactylus fuscus]|uniref:chordin n=1 Tax=Leptodactylus fuscus TaxID=238119 RepID=UPI003F4E67B2
MGVSYVQLLPLFTLWILATDASRRKVLLPIKPEQDPLPSKSQIGCHLGDRIYSLDDTWHPDLGKPFGIVYCVLCRCELFINPSGKEVGKIGCKSIKSHCPLPSCFNPVEVPGRCCRICPKTFPLPPALKKSEFIFDEFEYFQEKDDDLYNDRSYLSSDDAIDDSRTEYVAFLTASSRVWPPVNSGLAKAKFNLQRSNLHFCITYKGVDSLSRVRFSDTDGNVLFEHPVHRLGYSESDTICGIWRTLPRSSLHLLRLGHVQVSLVTASLSDPEISGKIFRYRAMFSESFSALLTPDSPEEATEQGLAMLTLSDVVDNLHFIIMLRGIQGGEQERIPITVQFIHQNHVIRELYANITAQEADFAEVLPNLSSPEMQWLAKGDMKIAVEIERSHGEHISGPITVRKSCDTLQSVLSGGDALNPTKTGAVGSATIILHDNGTVEYQLHVAGIRSVVTAVTIETKPRRKVKRNILHDLTKDFHDGKAWGLWTGTNARDLHMLLQSELFLNIATKEFPEGELRGQITPLTYSGLRARHEELPIPLAGQFVSPPLKTGSAGHAWVSLDEHCHLHYQIVVTGIGRAEDAALNAHLHGFAELGEVSESSHGHKRLLKGFYGSEAQGSVKDLDVQLFRHLNDGTAFIQVSTKLNPRGEIRGRVQIPNTCELGGGTRTPKDIERALTEKVEIHHPEDLRKDPRSCYFEGKLRAHGSRWAPDYDKKCSVCSCQKRTVICDPIVCQPVNCTQPIQLPDQCCPVCEEKKGNKEVKQIGRPQNEGCYFNGLWRAAGTSWHPVVEPFGLVLCATCSCKSSSQDLHCVRETCPRLTCASPIRANPMDCCKKCPDEEKIPMDLADRMQSDEPRQCKVMGQLYSNNEKWNPTVPTYGVVKCVTCVCVNGVPQCEKQKWSCSDPECSENPDSICCSECQVDIVEEDVPVSTWSY